MQLCLCVIAADNDAVRPAKSIVLSFDISKSAKLKCCDFSIPKKRDIKMHWKYVVLQYLVLGPGLGLEGPVLGPGLGLGLEPQVLVNITAYYWGRPLSLWLTEHCRQSTQ